MDVENVVLSAQEAEEAFALLGKVNDDNFNTLKLVEEMMEASELLVKSVTKIPELKPTNAQLIEELGDVLTRLSVLIYTRGISDEVYMRSENKLAMLYIAAKEGKMGSTVTVTKTAK